MTPLIRIVGCGRWLMQDDQVGLMVAGRLLERRIRSTVVETTETPVTAFAEAGPPSETLLIVVDAARADARHRPGSIKKVDYRSCCHDSSTEVFVDTHSPSLLSGLVLGETLGTLPAQVWLYVVFGEHFQRGRALSPRMQDAMAEVISEIETDIALWKHESGARVGHRQIAS